MDSLTFTRFFLETAGEKAGTRSISSLIAKPGKDSAGFAAGQAHSLHTDQNAIQPDVMSAFAGGRIGLSRDDYDDGLRQQLLEAAKAHAWQDLKQAAASAAIIDGSIIRPNTPLRRRLKAYARLITIIANETVPTDLSCTFEKQLDCVAADLRHAGDLLGDCVAHLVRSLLLRSQSTQVSEQCHSLAYLRQALESTEHAGELLQRCRRSIPPNIAHLVQLQILVYEMRIAVDLGDEALARRVYYKLADLEHALNDPDDRYDAARSMMAGGLLFKDDAADLFPVIFRACWYHDHLQTLTYYSPITLLYRILLWCSRMDLRVEPTRLQQLCSSCLASRPLAIRMRFEYLWYQLRHTRSAWPRVLAPLCFKVRTNAFTRNADFLISRLS